MGSSRGMLRLTCIWEGTLAWAEWKHTLHLKSNAFIITYNIMRLGNSKREDRTILAA